MSFAQVHASIALAFVFSVAACGPAVVVERVVSENQEPVAALLVSETAEARGLVTAAIDGTVDVDGTITHVELTWGDDTPAHAFEIAPDGTLPAFEHAYDRAGLFDVELAVTDDKGLVGRARTRITIAPPPDSEPPSIVSLSVARDGVELAEGERIAFGSVDVTVHATDLEAHLDHIEVNGSIVDVSGADATGTATVEIDVEGDVTLTAIAHDSFGFASMPVTFVLYALGPNSDSDGDGLVDLDDPAPALFNGLDVEMFALAEEIGEDFVGNQHAEDVVEALTSSIASDTVADVNLDVATSTAPWSVDDVTRSELFGLRYTGVLVAPEGATHVVVEVTADDVGVVFLDGVAVASADEEFATDFFRFNRAPAESDPVAIGASGRVPLEIVIANGAGAYAWSVRFRFLDGETTIMNPEAVSQRQFSVQE